MERAGRADDIRACIGCNQACIGHMQAGQGISCIQHPETGRERAYGTITPAARRRRVMVAGGGPAGMKAAAVAAARGHDVTLYEGGKRLGGQALLAQLLPRRAEFGGLVTNLERELSRAGVPTGLALAPFIPRLGEEHLAELVAAAAEAGARSAFLLLLRLPAEVLEVFRHRLEERLPDRAAAILAALSEMKAGKPVSVAETRPYGCSVKY